MDTPAPQREPPPDVRPARDLLAAEYARVRAKIERENYDYVTVVTGYEGSGKSTLALAIARYTEPTFSGENVAFEADDLLELMQNAPRGSTIIFDEAVKGLYSREFMSEHNRAITTAAMIARAKNYHLILCIPSFWNLDAYFRDHRARCWVHVERRGEAVIHVPSRSAYTKDVFWVRVMLHHFGPLTGPVWDAYEHRKMAFIQKALKRDQSGEEDETDRERSMAEEVAVNPSLWTAKGRPNVNAIRLAYGLSQGKAYSVASLARTIREGSY